MNGPFQHGHRVRYIGESNTVAWGDGQHGILLVKGMTGTILQGPLARKVRADEPERLAYEVAFGEAHVWIPEEHLETESQ